MMIQNANGMVEEIDLGFHVRPTFPEKYDEAVIRSAELCKVKKHLGKPPRFNISTKVAENHTAN